MWLNFDKLEMCPVFNKLILPIKNSYMPKKASKKSKSTVRSNAPKSLGQKKFFSGRNLRKIKQAKMPIPVPQTTPAEFAKLQQQWYAKLANSGFKDLEWVDHSTGKGHNTPHLKGSLHMGKPYRAGRSLYFDMAAAYLHHCKSLYGYDRFIWALHTSGSTYEDILVQIQKKYKKAPSKYTLYYRIQELAKRSYAWNKKYSDGVLYKRAEDAARKSEIDELLAVEYNWILGLEPIDL